MLRDNESYHRERLAVFWQNCVDAILTIDEQGIIQDINPGGERLLGYSSAELVGQDVSILMPEPYRSAHSGYIRSYRETGQAKIIGTGRRVPVRCKTGKIFPAHLAVTEFYYNGARYFSGSLRDISDVVEARARAAVEERKLLSRELHDSVSQALFGIVLGTQAALHSLANNGKTEEALQYVLSLAESGLAEMRALIFELRPESIEAEGIVLNVKRQGQALAGRYGLRGHFDLPDKEPDLGSELKHEVFRIIMEGLHNVVKHARAKNFWVAMELLPGLLVQPKDESARDFIPAGQARKDTAACHIRLLVRDDGVGFDPDAVAGGHFGLKSMEERVVERGGTLNIRSSAAEGTTLEISLTV